MQQMKDEELLHLEVMKSIEQLHPESITSPTEPTYTASITCSSYIFTEALNFCDASNSSPSGQRLHRLRDDNFHKKQVFFALLLHTSDAKAPTKRKHYILT